MRERASLCRFAERQPNEVVEAGLWTEFVLGSVHRSTRFRRLESEIGECGHRIRSCSTARCRRQRCAQPGDAEFALKFIGDAGGKLRANAVGAADHGLVALAYGASELIGRKYREDREGQPTADALAIAITHAHHLASARRIA